MVECLDCDGEGILRIIECGITTVEHECSRCEGTGQTEFDPDDNPYAPDNWKEAEGIA
jgi:DnaJ-class molecular chaperone